ncbi:hypothetical protein SESBI_33979 [Sesbania bispinosa]|nr:hypothetical protein SESBI_33979 [Sesbania bispinosa]
MGVNLLLFTFQDKKEVLEVIKKGPWFVMGHILSLQSWVPQASVYELNFNKVSFWVQLHGLPLDMMNTKNAAKIVNCIGHEQKSCSKDKVMSTIDRRTPKFSAKLGVPLAKSILALAREQGFWKHKVNQHNEGSSMDQREQRRKTSTKSGQTAQEGRVVAPQTAALSQQADPAGREAATSDIRVQRSKGKDVVEAGTPALRRVVTEHSSGFPQPLQPHTTKGGRFLRACN